MGDIQFSSSVQSCPTLCNPMDCSMPGLPVHHQLLTLLKLMSIKLVMLSNHLILCRPFLLQPSIFPSIRVFSNKSVLCIRWPKDWSFSFSISPSNEYSGLISFRMDWFDLLAVQGTSTWGQMVAFSFLQQIFPTQKLNQGHVLYRWILYQLSYQGSPLIYGINL